MPAQFTHNLLKWYDKHGRHDLPWQKNPTPYRVWVSEIMLQQTQVTTVIPYYHKFMNRFSSVELLAKSHEDEVLSYWSGLGYYARARNLHKTSKVIHEKYNNKFPQDIDLLSSLPGIGRSTAGAIVSFSKKIKGVILEGNVKRVLSRFHALSEPINQTSTINQLWQLAESYTPTERVHHYNQAIMDLGATVCIRKKPLCHQCPVTKNCAAFKLGTPENFPVKVKKKPRPQKQTRMIILMNAQQEVLLEKRNPIGIWGGLWCFPECKDIHEWLQKKGYKKTVATKQLPSLVHQFSHFQLTIEPYLISVKNLPLQIQEPGQQTWYKLNTKKPGGIPAPVAKLLAEITQHE